VNWSILGYISNGEIVPDVMTTLLKRSKTGLIASEGSRHLCSGIISQWIKSNQPALYAREMKDRIWNCSVIRLERLQDE
jgi:hypothetical protein